MTILAGRYDQLSLSREQETYLAGRRQAAASTGMRFDDHTYGGFPYFVDNELQATGGAGTPATGRGIRCISYDNLYSMPFGVPARALLQGPCHHFLLSLCASTYPSGGKGAFLCLFYC